MGTEALMNQVLSCQSLHFLLRENLRRHSPKVEHIITKLTKPREYYPPEGVPQDLGPTQGCTEAIKCLQMHCQLLKGSTSKEVLEVFHQEIGIRLIALVALFSLRGRLLTPELRKTEFCKSISSGRLFLLTEVSK
jgi:hypothetical protein